MSLEAGSKREAGTRRAPTRQSASNVTHMLRLHAVGFLNSIGWLWRIFSIFCILQLLLFLVADSVFLSWICYVFTLHMNNERSFTVACGTPSDMLAMDVGRPASRTERKLCLFFAKQGSNESSRLLYTPCWVVCMCIQTTPLPHSNGIYYLNWEFPKGLFDEGHM